MTEVLVPTSDFTADGLGLRFHELLTDGVTREEVAARNLLGLLDRYGDSPENAIEKVAKGQSESTPFHYAIVDETGGVQGGASRYDELPLRKLHVALPPGIAEKVPGLVTSYPHATSNIQAWTRHGFEHLLESAYGELAAQFQTYKSDGFFEATVGDAKHRVWTVEPMRSPDYVHEAILSAGLSKIASMRRFDDAESRRRVPPRSVLYARLHDKSWLTAHGRQKELRTGQPSFWTEWDRADEEMMSRNPKG